MPYTRKNTQDLKVPCVSSEYRPSCLNVKQQGESRSGSTPLQRTTPQTTSSFSKNTMSSSIGSRHCIIHVSNAVCDKNGRTKHRTKNPPEMRRCFLSEETWAQVNTGGARPTRQNVLVSPKGQDERPTGSGTLPVFAPLAREARVGRSSPTGVKGGGIPSHNPPRGSRRSGQIERPQRAK